MEKGQQSSSSLVVLACDATRDHNVNEFNLMVNEIRLRGDILGRGDTLLVLGVLHSVHHPMGYHTKIYTASLFGVNDWAIEDQVSKKVDNFISLLMQSAARCQDEGVSIQVKIVAGMPIKEVILQEAMSSNATWVLIDRQLRRDVSFYVKWLPCKVAVILDNLSVEVRKTSITTNSDVSEKKLFYSLSKVVQPSSDVHGSAKEERSIFPGGNYSASSNSLDSSEIHKFDSFSSSLFSSEGYAYSSSDISQISLEQAKSDHNKLKNRGPTVNQIFGNHQKYSETTPVLCAGCGLRTIMYIREAMRFRYSEILAATSEFSRENLLGEGGYGYVYKGRLKDGHIIAAKVWKQSSTQGYAEFFSEVYVLSFVRHKNIVMLLGYCSEMNQKILVYEYVCNKSLEWHLFDKSASALDWHKRRAIAIGVAKGLRFLHEECRGGPIIHRDLRPSNILLTHDFVPMLCDFGLAKWKRGEETIHTRVLGTLGYLAPEYAENGIVSVRTDVYAYGVVLLQLISGRKVFELHREEQDQALKQWAEKLIVKLALHELTDPCLGDAYDMHELYNMAKAAYLCVRESPEMRPSMSEVVRLLEGEHSRADDLAQQFIPHYTNMMG
ncbi:hypothetical protein Scep_002446 [Stephania cephalantha]|uniref:Protein kinase domain-containing protein n=1 Tax=Stephania cephalantha TaxID=152367 RepID=A0AAP0LB11_9MAGN